MSPEAINMQLFSSDARELFFIQLLPHLKIYYFYLHFSNNLQPRPGSYCAGCCWKTVGTDPVLRSLQSMSKIMIVRSL